MLMVRTLTLSLTLLLVSGTNAFVGPDISGRLAPPRRTSFARSKLLLYDGGATPPYLQSYATSSTSRRSSTTSTSMITGSKSGCYQAEDQLRQTVGCATLLHTTMLLCGCCVMLSARVSYSSQWYICLKATHEVFQHKHATSCDLRHTHMIGSHQERRVTLLLLLLLLLKIHILHLICLIQQRPLFCGI